MKKQSATKQILNLLNTKGGYKPKDLIKELKLPASNIYAGLAYLHKKKKIAKEEDGVYITQSLQMPLYKEKKAVSSRATTNKVALDNTKYIRSLETQVHTLEKLHDGWRQNYKKLEADYTQAKIMYLNSQAVVTYLEEKVAQLIKG
jgi:hypothetical protein